MSIFRRLFGRTARPVVLNSTLRVERLDDRALPSATAFDVLPGQSAAARGLVTQTSSTYDYNADGMPDEVNGGATKYNARGQVLEARYSGDWDNDGIADYTQVESFLYGAGNKLVGQTSVVDYPYYGYAYTYVASFTNDVRGNPIATQGTYDDGNDGTIDLAVLSVATYDARGNQLTNRYANDWGNDGIIDSGEASVSTYDTRGNLLTSRSGSDADYDGVIDVVYYTQTATYDNRGNTTSVNYAYDFDGDGVIDASGALNAVYDNRNNQVSSTEVWVDSYYGYSYSYAVANTFDSKGNQLTSRYAYDDGNDGTVEFRGGDDYTYDGKGNLLSSRSGDDTNNDGVIDVVIYSTTATYDSHGNRTSFSYAYDFNGDGLPDQQGTQTFTY